MDQKKLEQAARLIIQPMNLIRIYMKEQMLMMMLHLLQV